MKFRKCHIEDIDIDQVKKIGPLNKLTDLSDEYSTLQLQIPSIFSSLLQQNKQKSFVQSKIHQQKNEEFNSNLRARSRKNSQVKREKNKNISQSKANYYMFIKMLFPQASGIPALSINVMDTIFYNSDSTMTYLYYDNKRGLVKTKSKNYIDLFNKRKNQLDCNFDSNIKDNRSSIDLGDERTVLNQYQSKNQYLRNFHYVALLRYKDQSFIRLKQHQFKSLFIRPVQANQKYQMCNCQYLQLLPQQVNYQQGTIKNIQFDFHLQKNTSFFSKVLQKHSQQTSSFQTLQSSKIKEQLKNKNPQVYLLYIVFEIYAYVNLHYHKQIKSGVFQFMKVKDQYFLSNVKNIIINESDCIRNQYARANLFEQFVDHDGFDSQHDELRQNSGVISAISDLFDRQNKNICQKIRSMVNSKIQSIENSQDAATSQIIFKSINNKCRQSLQYLLQNQSQYERFLVKKQHQNKNGKLIHSSNIKKTQKNRFKSQFRSLLDKQNENKKGRSINEKNKQISIDNKSIIRGRPTTSKWYVQTLKGKKYVL